MIPPIIGLSTRLAITNRYWLSLHGSHPQNRQEISRDCVNQSAFDIPGLPGFPMQWHARISWKHTFEANKETIPHQF